MNHPFNDPGLASPDAPDYSAESAIALIKDHIPSITDEDDAAMDGAYAIGTLYGTFDWADAAKRTCHCGRKIEDFYDYVDHLEEVFRGNA